MIGIGLKLATTTKAQRKSPLQNNDFNSLHDSLLRKFEHQQTMDVYLVEERHVLLHVFQSVKICSCQLLQSDVVSITQIYRKVNRAVSSPPKKHALRHGLNKACQYQQEVDYRATGVLQLLWLPFYFVLLQIGPYFLITRYTSSPCLLASPKVFGHARLPPQ